MTKFPKYVYLSKARIPKLYKLAGPTPGLYRTIWEYRREKSTSGKPVYAYLGKKLHYGFIKNMGVIDPLESDTLEGFGIFSKEEVKRLKKIEIIYGY